MKFIENLTRTRQRVVPGSKREKNIEIIIHDTVPLQYRGKNCQFSEIIFFRLFLTIELK